MGHVESVVIVGDYAKGIDNGTIEVVLVGHDLNADYIEQLVLKIENEISRKVHLRITERNEGEGLVIYDTIN